MVGYLQFIYMDGLHLLVNDLLVHVHCYCLLKRNVDIFSLFTWGSTDSGHWYLHGMLFKGASTDLICLVDHIAYQVPK